MKPWPTVLTEDDTLDRVLDGASLARFGDGEINLIGGGLCISQKPVGSLSVALQMVIERPGKCLVGIPHLRGPKQGWTQYHEKMCELFTDPPYASAFITRPDSAPWINSDAYWEKVSQLWKGKRVALVRGSPKSLTGDMLRGVESIQEIIGPVRDAWHDCGPIMDRIRSHCQIVLICLGPTATVMAHRLSLEGIHAVDLGHLGMFYRKHLRGWPMTVTDQDKAYDRFRLINMKGPDPC